MSLTENVQHEGPWTAVARLSQPSSFAPPPPQQESSALSSFATEAGRVVAEEAVCATLQSALLPSPPVSDVDETGSFLGDIVGGVFSSLLG
jgi:hypothetical protein